MKGNSTGIVIGGRRIYSFKMAFTSYQQVYQENGK